MNISDKHPPKTTFLEILVFDKDEDYDGGFEVRVGMWWNDELVKADSYIGFNNPTHWMLLPKPPKE